MSSGVKIGIRIGPSDHLSVVVRNIKVECKFSTAILYLFKVGMTRGLFVRLSISPVFFFSSRF